MATISNDANGGEGVNSGAAMIEGGEDDSEDGVGGKSRGTGSDDGARIGDASEGPVAGLTGSMQHLICWLAITAVSSSKLPVPMVPSEQLSAQGGAVALLDSSLETSVHEAVADKTRSATAIRGVRIPAGPSETG